MWLNTANKYWTDSLIDVATRFYTRTDFVARQQFFISDPEEEEEDAHERTNDDNDAPQKYAPDQKFLATRLLFAYLLEK